ncbi:MAG: DUF4190 domain-containing protein [Slackia sp.]|nr:DUF4190 domain-containing protein [Slackia sp.]
MEDKKEPLAPKPAPDDQEKSIPAPEPVKPAEPAAPAELETASAAPAAPKSEPAAAPAKPAEPATPAEPAPAPAEPAAPAAPAQPAAPAAPAVPQAPAQPTAPVAPQAPQPAAPAAPAQPAAPTQPAGAPVAAPGVAPTQPMPAPAQPAAGPAGQPVPAPMGGAYPPPPAPSYAPKSGKAMGALVCGILAIVFSFIPIVGIILGIVAIVFAGKAVREAGHDGKATGGKVCGILGIVFSVLWGIFSLVLTLGIIGAASSYEDYDRSDYVPPVSSVPDSSSAEPAVDMDAEEQAVYDETAAIFEKIVAKDSQFMTELSQEFNDSFEDSFSMSCAELGIDPSAFAEWAVTDFSYEIDSVYVDGDTATVYVDTTERDTFEFLMGFSDAVAAYGATAEGEGATPDAAKAKVGELFSQTMAETTDTTTYFAAVDFVKKDGVWVAVEDSLEEEFDYMFGTF